ncbi:MAG TPA: hypothetical protein VIG86_12335 [Candidatus Dormibacteraeota bacterium]|jgi:hypothetical protein
MSIVRRLAKDLIVTVAAALVISAILYGVLNNRLDVVVVNIAELLLVGLALLGVRSWRAHNRSRRMLP